MISACLIGTMFFAFKCPAPVSTSCDEDMTASIILLNTSIGAFNGGAGSSALIGKLGLSLRKINAPARERLLDLLKHDASDYAHKSILDAW